MTAIILWTSPALLAAIGWATLALYFRGPRRDRLRHVCIAAWLALAAAGLVVAIRGPSSWLEWLAVIAATAAFVIIAGGWSRIAPRRDRDWAADVSRELVIHQQADQVVLDNVRDFRWRTREDFDVHWVRRRYDLSTLTALDLFVSYWSGPAIAHTLVSFAFADGRHLVFSVEVRRQQGQRFSALGGLFKQAELALVAADERDIIHTRAKARGERVVMYRVQLPAAERRGLFEAYLDQARRLAEQPRFYNTLLSNCTSIIYDMVKRIVPGVAWDRRLLLSGYLPAYLYELGVLDTSRPLAELTRRGHINPQALVDENDGAAAPSFSRLIRQGVPAPDGSLIETEPDLTTR